MKSGKDYNICFQSIILSLIDIIKTLELTNDIEGRWGGLFTCCVEEAFEGDFEMTSPPKYPGVPLGKKVSEITVRNRRHAESNVVLSPADATAVINGIKWASHMGWRESKGVTPNFVNLTEFARMNFKTFIDTLATRLVYLSNGDRHYVLFRIYDAHDSHGISALARTLLQCGGFKAVGRLTGGAYPRDMDDASEIIRDVLIRATSPYSTGISPYVLDTASIFEEERLRQITIDYFGFSPKVGRLGNEAAMTSSIRSQEIITYARGIIAIPSATVKLRRPMLHINDPSMSTRDDVYQAILTVGLLPYTSEIVEICVAEKLLDVHTIAVFGDRSGKVCAVLGHITEEKKHLLVPITRAKLENNEDVALLSPACTNDPCSLNIDQETMIKSSVRENETPLEHKNVDLAIYITGRKRKMQPARGRFARSDLDRQMASTFPCPLESGPSSRFLGQPATGTRRVTGTTHTESGRC